MIRYALPLALVSALIAITAYGARAQARKMSVMDYYLTLPDDCFYCEIVPDDLSAAFKRKQITKSNIPAGYIEARSEGYSMQVALFTAPGIRLVAVNRPCGAGCMCNMFRLLVPQPDGGWKDYEGFPSEEDINAKIGKKARSHEFLLPEVGTDIKIIDPETGKTLLLIGWVGGKFRIK